MMVTQCPYCNRIISVCEEWTFEDNESYEETCPNCNKIFIYSVTTECSYSFAAKKADCLNGGQHKFEIVHLIPPEKSYKRCVCGEQRAFTEFEMKEY